MYIKKNLDSEENSVGRDEMRELDRKAIEEYGIPGIILMENAGRNVAEEVIRSVDGDNNRIAVICGKGNNGGDGFVIARHLYNSGYDVILFLMAKVDDILSDGDAGLNLRIIKNMNFTINEVLGNADIESMINNISGCSLIVDAIFGTGLKGELREPARSIIKRINNLNIPVIAVDIPSGLDCNEGKALGACLKAKKTVTFALPKKGFFAGNGPEYVGELLTTDISIPKDLFL